MYKIEMAFILFIIFSIQCAQNGNSEMSIPAGVSGTSGQINSEIMDTITLGAGCFWCVEAIFDQLEGVKSVESGYSGGTVKNPSYKEVCTGSTGHAEVCQLIYDPNVISVEEILEVFWQAHDPTTLNKQGADVGTQYRSVIFYHNDAQRKIAIALKDELNKAGVWQNPVVTEITEFEVFYKAEDYHQEYFENNPNQPYCRAVVQPKVEKFQKIFKDRIKK